MSNERIKAGGDSGYYRGWWWEELESGRVARVTSATSGLIRRVYADLPGLRLARDLRDKGPDMGVVNGMPPGERLLED